MLSSEPVADLRGWAHSLLFTHQTAATSRMACQQVSQCPVPADSPTGSLCGPGSVPTQATENFAPFRPRARLAKSFLCVTPGVEEVPKVPPSCLSNSWKGTLQGQRPQHTGQDPDMLPASSVHLAIGGARRSTTECLVGALTVWRGRGRTGLYGTTKDTCN